MLDGIVRPGDDRQGAGALRPLSYSSSRPIPRAGYERIIAFLRSEPALAVAMDLDAKIQSLLETAAR